jgi:osmotically-inducible protein OsmY
MNFRVKDLDIRLDEGRATITGGVSTPEDKEQMTLLVSNVEGITSVDNRLAVEPES